MSGTKEKNGPYKHQCRLTLQESPLSQRRVERQHEVVENATQNEPEAMDDVPSTLDTDSGLQNHHSCPNSMEINSPNARMSLKCQEQFDSAPALKTHKMHCAFRWRDDNAQKMSAMWQVLEGCNE